MFLQGDLSFLCVHFYHENLSSNFLSDLSIPFYPPKVKVLPKLDLFAHRVN